ncbi:hypothetical protein [Protofrankia sp. BMG5.30]|uniref:hypothetical protein n=1 Tax=Protofrankia sp. BMG5.30 TaxID=1834514 RepID=UPI000976CA9F|nr:hypothetical protein [Protofrankia sp. BMG5.30]ONH35722.1 hypothetical protein BL254_10560 [Protofrankia sp. BMG5.30]
MKVRFLRRVANPVFSAQPGDVRDLPEQDAAKRIAAGDCVAVDQPKPRLRDRLRRQPELAAPPAPADKPLDRLTVDELREYADEHDIDLGEASKKADIIAVIRAAAGEGDGAG